MVQVINSFKGQFEGIFARWQQSLNTAIIKTLNSFINAANKKA
jgi:hypothetical protein